MTTPLPRPASAADKESCPCLTYHVSPVCVVAIPGRRVSMSSSAVPIKTVNQPTGMCPRKNVVSIIIPLDRSPYRGLYYAVTDDDISEHLTGDVTMGSLLQFNGRIDRKRGVGLMFTSAECYECPQCGKSHEQLYRAWRKPCGMYGPWVVFRYNGAEHVPDLSVPIRIDQLPRDAQPMTIEECAAYWHSSSDAS